MKEKLANYFKAYSNNECFATADGQLFHKKSDAISHASTLSDRKVTSHKRNENLPELKVEDQKPEDQKPEEEKPEDEKPEEVHPVEEAEEVKLASEAAEESEPEAEKKQGKAKGGKK